MRHDGNEEKFKHRQIDGEREGVGVIDKNFIGEWMKIAFRKVATIWLIRYFEWCKTGDSVHRLYKKHFKRRIYFPSLRLASNSDKPLKRASSLRHYLNFKHCHDVPLGKDIQR